jgi:hypothetical protein
VARPPLALPALVLAGALALAGCRDDTVRVAFRPRPGDRSAYRIEVHATTLTSVDGEPPRRAVTDSVFEARQVVVATGRAGTTVEVHLRERGGRTLTFLVSLDRAAQLTEVQRIEGLPAGALGDLGLSEIFPPAVAGPPDRRLGPGDRWAIDEPVQVGESPAARLVGHGRLVELGVVAGHKVAKVENEYRLPVRGPAGEANGRLRLDGWQATRASGAYAVADGAVVSAEARTSGTFRLTVLPPEGTLGAPVPGTLTVDVRSVTRRAD